MNLESVMIREVVQARPHETVTEAAGRMREKAVGCLVVTLDGVVKGIITDRDLLACLAENHDPHRCPVSAHMRRPVIVLKPDEDHLSAAKVMRGRKIKRLPVAKNGRLLGMISLSDLAALALEEAERVRGAWDFFREVVNAQAAQGAGAPRARPAALPASVSAPADAGLDESALIDAGGPG
jgi:CBS domain-containing protein